VGQFRVTGYVQPAPDHLAYLVDTAGGRVLHLADPIVNRDLDSRKLDPLWERFADLRPDLLFLSAGGNCTRGMANRGGKPWIQEHSIVSPVEAARVAALIKPKVAAVIGIYNNSIWKGRAEFVLPAGIVEEAFYWALEHLAPEIGVVTLKPGFLFDLAGGKVTCSPSVALMPRSGVTT
jgi:hypothetical protein